MEETMKKYVIVGGVAGGAGVAARLRRLDESAEITVFERGKHISFANCGLPYYAGGVIENRDALFVMTPEKFKASLNVTAKVQHEVTAINPAAKTVTVKRLNTGAEVTESYDTLILSPGASPIRPPIPGINDDAIYTLRSVADIDAIKQRIDNPATKRVRIYRFGNGRKSPPPRDSCVDYRSSRSGYECHRLRYGGNRAGEYPQQGCKFISERRSKSF